MLGYCPGTAVEALGEGRTDAIAGLIGMVLGGMLLRGVLSPDIERDPRSWRSGQGDPSRHYRYEPLDMNFCPSTSLHSRGQVIVSSPGIICGLPIKS